jgi:RsmE family RNA methyltransferase
MNIILFEQGESSFLTKRDERAVHLLKVLRKTEGEAFDAGILGGALGTGIIRRITQDGVECSLTLDTDPPPRTPIRLGVGFPRPIQLRRLLRDCASLGVMAVDLISTELGEKSYRDTKLLETSDGVHRTGAMEALIEGAAQARDTRLPELAQYATLSAWLELIRQQQTAAHSVQSAPHILIAADNVRPMGSFSTVSLPPLSAPPALHDAAIVGNTPTVTLAVGSERGWSDRERDMLEQAGFIRLSMGSRALRTETACTAAIILLMEKLGLLG